MHQAKSRLSKLIATAEAGDEVIIACNGKPAVRLVPLSSSGFRFGTLAHLATTTPDFDDRPNENEPILWERSTLVDLKSDGTAAAEDREKLELGPLNRWN